ncbi:hypothetical protein [Helicobacter pylori]|uniref:hypothetical protein n=1 Tax=Helicobacter pylori TaxID=210 RepID=UPI000681EDE8|nr:hypothetical protein [Helicobacter pylori]KNE15085.1 hypothetical protein ACM30_05435 [Helicobacter pylori]
MGAILSILKLEIKSYLTNTSALFWTFIYPILMLLLLVFVFSKNTTIGQLFIKTSVFYQLNQLLLKSFQGIDPILILITSTLFIVCGITLFLLSANRMLLIPRERMR